MGFWEKVGNEVGKTVQEVGEAITGTGNYAIPKCPYHQEYMKVREGHYGKYWACPVKEKDGYCRKTAKYG